MTEETKKQLGKICDRNRDEAKKLLHSTEYEPKPFPRKNGRIKNYE